MLFSAAATNAALPNGSRSTKQRFSQTSTTVATPRPQSPSAPIISTGDDLADLRYEVFQTRDSLEIARASFAHKASQREAGRRALFPSGGRCSLDLARRNIERSRLQQHRQEEEEEPRRVTDATAHTFLKTIGSRFWEDRAALLSDPVLDWELNHRDSLELPREKKARSLAAARRSAKKPVQRVVAKAKACGAALSGFAGRCFQGGAESTLERGESKVGLLE
jgi:hypothetical protein